MDQSCKIHCLDAVDTLYGVDLYPSHESMSSQPNLNTLIVEGILLFGMIDFWSILKIEIRPPLVVDDLSPIR